MYVVTESVALIFHTVYFDRLYRSRFSAALLHLETACDARMRCVIITYVVIIVIYNNSYSAKLNY